jgi:hypothetical protein
VVIILRYFLSLIHGKCPDVTLPLRYCVWFVGTPASIPTRWLSGSSSRVSRIPATTGIPASTCPPDCLCVSCSYCSIRGDMVLTGYIIYSDNNNLRREEEPLQLAAWLAWLEFVFAAVPKVRVLIRALVFDTDELYFI